MKPGTRIRWRYRAETVLFRSGAGQVWRARDKSMERYVVLKQVTGSRGPWRARNRRAVAEQRFQGTLNHPNVVIVHDLLRKWLPWQSGPWLVLESLPDGDLTRRPPFPPRLAAHVGAQLADALDAVHRQGIVHGDIKPANAVTAPGGKVKITDFGSARPLPGYEEVLPGGNRRGYTMEFAAPEVLRGLPPEPGSDVYSLAVTMHALMGGPLPDPGAPLDPSSGAGPENRPAPLRDLLSAMTRPDPANRPGIADVRRRLEEVTGPVDRLPDLPGKADAKDTRGEPDPLPPRPLRRKIAAYSAPVLVAALACLFLWSPWSGDGDGPPSLFDGDPRAADPCSLLDSGAFPDITTELVRDYGNFDRCDLIVSSDGREVADVEVDLANDVELSGPKRTAGYVTIAEDPAKSGHCVR